MHKALRMLIYIVNVADFNQRNCVINTNRFNEQSFNFLNQEIYGKA
jgi:hypothetical protein